MLGYIVLIICAYVFYEKFVKPAIYWKVRCVFHVDLYPRFVKVFVSDKNFLETVKDAYDEFPERRYYGSYQFFRPSLFLRDLELIKKITIKDFDHFHDHLSTQDEKVDPAVTQNLFSLKGQKWRDMRTTLSPVFTSSKMRHMFTLIAATADNFTNYFLEQCENSKVELEMKECYSKYTNDVIASCAFGIECDSLKNKGNEFFKMGQIFSGSFRGRAAWRGLLVAFFPTITNLFKISVFPRHVSEFFKRIVKETIAYREQNGIVRPDLIHLLMQARKGQLKDDEVDSETAGFATVEESNAGKNGDKTELTDDLITAQALVFFFAGFETSSTLLAFLSYELALNPDIQRKLQKEIDETMEKTSGKLDYDAVLKMRYLDQVVSETLRMYPPGFALSRLCTKEYLIPAKNPNEKDLTLEKGALAIVPVYALQMDPDYFPNPKKFDPERFSEENKINIVPGTYMPFGSGPRNCIGSRFALLETKALVASLCSKLNLVPIERTEIPIKIAKTAILGPKNGMWLGLERRMNVN